MYNDTHAHILGEEFDEDREEMLKRAEEKHVDRILIITLDNDETKRGLQFIQRDKRRFQLACGIFPTDAMECTEERYKEFEQLAEHPDIFAIGEIGLDYYWQKSEEERSAQRALLHRQLTLAERLNKPVLIHSRDAIGDTYDILASHSCRGLIHSYSGSAEMAERFIDLGYELALGGPVTFKNARHAVEVVQAVDLHHLLTETDSPYMAPVPVRGTRNEPSNIPYIVEKMAEIKGMSVEETARILDENYTRFLKGERWTKK